MRRERLTARVTLPQALFPHRVSPGKPRRTAVGCAMRRAAIAHVVRGIEIACAVGLRDRRSRF
eukprot:1135196-Rhodomonas_salina.9